MRFHASNQYLTRQVQLMLFLVKMRSGLAKSRSCGDSVGNNLFMLNSQCICGLYVLHIDVRPLTLRIITVLLNVSYSLIKPFFLPDARDCRCGRHHFKGAVVCCTVYVHDLRLVTSIYIFVNGESISHFSTRCVDL